MATKARRRPAEVNPKTSRVSVAGLGKPVMALVIENIDSARLREGIDDVGLREGVAHLGPEDRIRLSMSGDGKLFETLTVRVTSRRGLKFRGKLTSKPRTAGLKGLVEGAVVVFSADQVHSIVACKNKFASAPLDKFSPAPDTTLADDVTVSNFTRPVKIPAKTSPQAKNKKKSTPSRLKVEGDATRHFIRVPVNRSSELHGYLRSRRVRSSPPQPYYSDFDCIELDRAVDVAGVQAILDSWH